MKIIIIMCVSFSYIVRVSCGEGEKRRESRGEGVVGLVYRP